MIKTFYAAALLLLTVSCTLTKKPTAYEQPTQKRINNKYILNSPYGHKLEVEIDYTLTSAGYLNNDAEIQYIITNVGTKDLKQETFVGGTTVFNNTMLDSLYSLSDIVFEFTTTDNKRIEAIENLLRGSNNLPVGKSNEARTLRINAGNRLCTGVKPVRLETKFAGFQPSIKK